MGRRRGHGVGDRPNGRRAGIRRDVLALVRNQASTCLPPPVPRGDRQRTRCPPQPRSHRFPRPKGRFGSQSFLRHQATGDDEGSRGRRTPQTLRLHEAREGAGRFSRSPYGRGGRGVSGNPTIAAATVPRRTPGPRHHVSVATQRPSRAPGLGPGFRRGTGRVSEAPPAIYRAPPSWRPRAPKAHPRLWCSPLTQRIVPDEARITTLSVVSTPSRRRLTPSSSEPAVTPVAAKIASPFTRSSSS